MRFSFNTVGFAPLAGIMLLPLWAPAVGADTPAGSGFTDPAEIDRTVSTFTGAQIGEIGGARSPADRRLRLAHCSAPLSASWHGRNQSTVKVACLDQGGWHVFIATRPQQAAAAKTQIVKRGDPMTILVRGRGFTVQQNGEAMENGTIGEWIGVRTARRATPVQARIERPGLAIIPAN
ncbi:flagella basal body P-ring formation protein FlgA [Erythrobacter sp. F6033]|uniref:flagella basal body P-ring formation protein FlgA n=1 Tax=Erythrobacter sp. F6033 TaxID=2926401 RepID=UPI001FF1B24B|nr:flagella basal body P-ring formation protein FlgA [Erythrobacter sp. F6033]MCK0129447.1 flagella basal body P-ring formation protein FlgA [Erythrobacter sp. F6033]